jgi:hypothetical protein
VQCQRANQFELNAGGQLIANSVERAIDAACQSTHTSGRSERDESNDKSIFNQVLTLFTVLQVLELQIKLD